MRLDKISRRGHRGEMGRALANPACGSFHDGCYDRQAIVRNLVVHDGKLHPRGHPQGGDHGTVHVIVNGVCVALVGIPDTSGDQQKHPDERVLEPRA
jgi:hypothetical protein